MLLFSYSGSWATTDVASTEKDRLERKRLRPFQHFLSDDSSVPPLQQQCNITFSVKTYSILTACTGEIHEKNQIKSRLLLLFLAFSRK